MPAIPKLTKKKSKKQLKEPVKPELVLHESFNTEPDTSDDFFFTTRRVRFSASVDQQVIMTIDEYSDQERKLTWYDRQDKAEMNRKHDKMVRRYEAGKRCKEGMTYRGLDAWTDKGQTKFEALMDRLLAVVLDEQDDQWEQNTSDPDRIARVSRSISKRSVAQAIKWARQDELEAIEAYKGDFKEDDGSEEEESNASGHKRQGRRRSSTTKARRRASKERPDQKKDSKKKRSSKKKKSSSRKKSSQ